MVRAVGDPRDSWVADRLAMVSGRAVTGDLKGVSCWVGCLWGTPEGGRLEAGA